MEKGYMILSSLVQGKTVEEEKREKLLAEVSKLAKDPTPDNRYRLSELVEYTINDMIMQRLNFLQDIADVRNGALGDKPEFKLNYSGITAKIGAKGHTPEVSMISSKKVVVPTVEISSRPKVNFRELIADPMKIVDMVNDAMRAMENEMVQYIEGVLYTSQSVLSAPNYASGAGIVKATFDEQLRAIQRLNGEATILGDITMIHQITALTGFSNRVADDLMIQHNQNGFIGVYLGASVNQLMNRYSDESSIAETNLVLRDDVVYILPVGAPEARPLKVFMEGAVRAMDNTNPEDESFELFIRMDFGSQVVTNQNKLAMYEDTNE